MIMYILKAISKAIHEKSFIFVNLAHTKMLYGPYLGHITLGYQFIKEILQEVERKLDWKKKEIDERDCNPGRVTRGRSHPILYLSLRVIERAEVLAEFFETSDD